MFLAALVFLQCYFSSSLFPLVFAASLHVSPPPCIVHSSGTCDACGASGGNNACIGCDETHPYSDYNCEGQCDFTEGMYYQDPYGGCCEAINATNCLGRCGNNHYSQGLVPDGSYAVCCKNVDCAGYCSGTASVDQW